MVPGGRCAPGLAGRRPGGPVAAGRRVLIGRGFSRCASGLAKLAKVGVLEVVAVFPAVTQTPVRADMREPDQAEGQDQRPALPPAETRHRGRQGGAVREVVQARASAPDQPLAIVDVATSSSLDRSRGSGISAG